MIDSMSVPFVRSERRSRYMQRWADAVSATLKKFQGCSSLDELESASIYMQCNAKGIYIAGT
jgi:hypothetical protein